MEDLHSVGEAAMSSPIEDIKKFMNGLSEPLPLVGLNLAPFIESTENIRKAKEGSARKFTIHSFS